jgi:hypothetical protein
MENSLSWEIFPFSLLRTKGVRPGGHFRRTGPFKRPLTPGLEYKRTGTKEVGDPGCLVTLVPIAGNVPALGWTSPDGDVCRFAAEY